MKSCILSICLLLFVSCESDIQLKRTLELSGDNRLELNKVLTHYKNDSLKLKAAKFLIRNMQGNLAYDSTNLYKYRPILLKLDSLRQQGGIKNKIVLDSINKEWHQFIRDKSIKQDIYSQLQLDIYHITADYLIDNIDKSFEAWQKTLFRDSVNFDAYLQYILPYRRYDGYVIEPWRDYFTSRYGQFVNKCSSPSQAVDSLLNLVSEYQVEWDNISNYPYICLNDYNLSKMSRCTDKCWFNSMLLSALGIPCAIDFVPAWGNRNSSHVWNSIIINGKTYSFEGTGGKGMWKNQLVYNNVWVDEYWMKSRLPKVFRYSYESIQEGPTTDRNSNKENTPSRFLSSKYKDVSDEYFATSNIHIQIKNKMLLNKSKYAYLCVFNEDKWQPIYWGVVKSSEVYFEKMGRDIVYLPAFYENGQIIPFNDAFILKEDGRIHFLTADEKVEIPVTLDRKYYTRPDLRFWKEWNIGSYFEIANNPQFTDAKKVYTVSMCESRPTIWMLDKPIHTRYIRYLFPEKKDILAELAFYQKNKDQELALIEGEVLTTDEKALEEVNKLFDKNILTYADLVQIEEDATKKETLWVGMDFGEKIQIDAIEFCPRNDKNNIIKGLEYELFYWNNRWISLGRKIATDYKIEYDNSPGNSLLLLKCTTEGVENRIFTWEENALRWW